MWKGLEETLDEPIVVALTKPAADRSQRGGPGPLCNQPLNQTPLSVRRIWESWKKTQEHYSENPDGNVKYFQSLIGLWVHLMDGHIGDDDGWTRRGGQECDRVESCGPSNLEADDLFRHSQTGGMGTMHTGKPAQTPPKWTILPGLVMGCGRYNYPFVSCRVRALPHKQRRATS